MSNYLKYYDLKCPHGRWVIVDYLDRVTRGGFDSYESARDWLVAHAVDDPDLGGEG